MRRPPVGYLYYNTWFALVVGVGCIGLAPFDRAWQPLAIGLGFLVFGILYTMFLASWRERYNESHPEGQGLVDDRGYPVPRSELLADRARTWAIKWVQSWFR